MLNPLIKRERQLRGTWSSVYQRCNIFKVKDSFIIDDKDFNGEIFKTVELAKDRVDDWNAA